MITNAARCTGKIKFRIAMAKAALNKKKNLFTSKFDFKFKEETGKVVHL